MFKIAHISDLHFSKPSFDPRQFFSKRWIGNLNYLFFRKHLLDQDRPYTLIPLFKELGIDLVVVAGDISSTSYEKEFALGKAYIDALTAAGIPSLIIPGNHDNYTFSSSKRRLFYRYFPNEELKNEGLSLRTLSKGLHLISLDTTIRAPLLKSTGRFSSALETRLKKTLDKIPSSDKVVLVNHFPFFHNGKPRHILENGEELKLLLKSYPNCQLYLHGHTHRHIICDLRPSGLPIVVDSGCLVHKKEGTWNLIELTSQACSITGYEWKEGWQPFKKGEFTW